MSTMLVTAQQRSGGYKERIGPFIYHRKYIVKRAIVDGPYAGCFVVWDPRSNVTEDERDWKDWKENQ